MLTAPIVGLFMSHLPTLTHTRTFFIEAVGVVGFAIYWAFKSRELALTKADRLAIQGRLQVERSRRLLKGNRVRQRAEAPTSESSR
jgi:hypothetical protein